METSERGASGAGSPSGGAPSAAEAEQTARWDLTAAEMDTLAVRADELDPLNSLLIARGDSLIAIRTYRGLEPGEAVNVKSASKSLLSALVGLAIEDGHLRGVEQPIGDFFPEVLAEAPEKQAITINDLLTMRAGLESTSFGNYGAWVTSDNWVRHALKRPLVQAPGTEPMIYSTGTTHLLAAILTKAVGQPLRGYAQERLFDPLGVRIQAWQQDPQGIYFGGNNLAVPPTALLRVGQMYLNDGRWNETQVLPADWVARTWTSRVTKTYRGFEYGYLWWMEELGGRETWFAWGYGGQMLFVVPELDLVTVMTSSLDNRPKGLHDHTGRLIRFMGEVVRATGE